MENLDESHHQVNKKRFNSDNDKIENETYIYHLAGQSEKRNETSNKYLKSLK